MSSNDSQAATGTATARGSLPAPALIALCFLLMLCEGYDVQSLGVAAPKLMPALNIAMAQRGELFGIGQWGVVLGALGGGYIADCWSRRGMLFIATLIFGTMTLATAHATSFSSLLIVRLIAGLGLGAAIPCVIGVALDIASPMKRVRTVTMIMAGLPLGGSIAAGIAATVMAEWGWQAIFYLGGALPLLMLPTLLLLPMSESATPSMKKARPSFSMLLAHGRAPITLAIGAIYFITLLIVYLLINWLPQMMIEQGVSEPRAHLLAMAFNLSAAVGCVLLGVLTDRLGPLRIIPIAYVLMLGAALTTVLADSYVQSLIGFAGLGLLLLGAQNALNGVIPSFYPPQARALSVGAAVSMGRVGSIVGPLCVGFALAAGHAVQSILWAIVILIALAAVLAPLLIRAGMRVAPKPDEFDIEDRR